MRRPTYYISTRNGTSDLVGQMVGAFVSSAMVFQQTDPDYYATLMQAAVNLYGAGTRFQGMYVFLSLIMETSFLRSVETHVLPFCPDVDTS